jgi:PAS domain-containing protein
MKQELTASDLDTSKFGTLHADFPSLLAELEDQIEDLFELSSFGAYTITEDGTCTRINSQALKWLGCSRDAILGKKSLQKSSLVQIGKSCRNVTDNAVSIYSTNLNST